MRRIIALAACVIFALPVAAQDALAVSAPGGELRVLDKLTGEHVDLTLQAGEKARLGYLHVTMHDCRYLEDNPSGEAYINVTVQYRDDPAPIFEGWMLASSPALNAMDHQRYDVWALRCTIS